MLLSQFLFHSFSPALSRYLPSVTLPPTPFPGKIYHRPLLSLAPFTQWVFKPLSR
ncbi:hypothetical protein BT69DRAFT_1287113 [Atractiella rhizophila]|nr:hypothetical protein BT69DRAFT_1287113 [Atractiella rhizophila]